MRPKHISAFSPYRMLFPVQFLCPYYIASEWFDFFLLSLIDLGLIPARYILAILGSIAMAIVYGLKVNLSVAMVAMLNHTALKLSSDAHNTAHTTIIANSTGDSMDSCASDTTASTAVEVIWYTQNLFTGQTEKWPSHLNGQYWMHCSLFALAWHR